jgi:hypothetical protein
MMEERTLAIRRHELLVQILRYILQIIDPSILEMDGQSAVFPIDSVDIGGLDLGWLGHQ